MSMNKNPSERKTVSGNQREELDRDVQEKEGQQGQHKEGQKGMGDRKKDQKSQGQQEEHTQQKHHRQGDPMGQQPKPFDPNKARKQNDSDVEDTGPGERKRA